MNFDDIVEKVFAIWTEEEQLDEDFIDDKRQLIPFETNFEEAEDVSSIVGDDDNADDELQDCENRTGDIEDLDEGETGYQDSEDKRRMTTQRIPQESRNVTVKKSEILTTVMRMTVVRTVCTLIMTHQRHGERSL